MSRSEKILNFMHNLSVEVDFCKKWSVDYYLTAAGLDVDPHYRRLGLGTHLLLARYLLLIGINSSIIYLIN